MSEVLRLKSVGLAAHGPVLTLSLARGQSVAIIGPAASGKSRLLKYMSAQDAPPTGQVDLTARAIWPSPIKDKKATPQQLARTGSASGQAGRASDALNAARLWQHRQAQVSELSPSQQAACEILGVLSCEDALMCIDCNLDHLDPWALRSVLELIRARLANGCSAAFVTNRPDIVEQCDLVVVVNNGEVRHAGRVQDLTKKASHHLEVVAERQQGVRALVTPFTVEVHQKNGALVMSADDGQQLAAKLLLEGYGDVKYVVHRQPTLEECLLGLI
jgi:ABC-type multidrug transport system ATPase subunit